MIPEINEFKDIQELINDYRKTEILLKENRWDELERHIQEVISKHCVEVAAYNVTAKYPPRNIQENAVNCMEFLKRLLLAKGISDFRQDMHPQA